MKRRESVETGRKLDVGTRRQEIVWGQEGRMITDSVVTRDRMITDSVVTRGQEEK